MNFEERKKITEQAFRTYAARRIEQRKTLMERDLVNSEEIDKEIRDLENKGHSVGYDPREKKAVLRKFGEDEFYIDEKGNCIRTRPVSLRNFFEDLRDVFRTVREY